MDLSLDREQGWEGFHWRRNGDLEIIECDSKQLVGSKTVCTVHVYKVCLSLY